MVLIRRPEGKWHEPESSKYDNEKAMQDLVKLSPTLLPGGEELAIVDELSLPGTGFVDLVGVGANGLIVVVECKLRANPEIRREVVGQVFAYAGGLWRMDYDQFDALFTARAGKGLYESVKAATASELDEGQFRAAVGANLAAGAFRLIVAVDEITSELKTIIEFLNSHTSENVQVLALELQYVKDGDVELLTPIVYGAESTAKKQGAVGNKWTEESFSEELDRRSSPEAAAYVRKLIQHGRDKGSHFYFGSAVTPGMSCYYMIDGVEASVWQVYLYPGEPTIALSVGGIAGKTSAQRAMAVVNYLRSDPTLIAPLSAISAENINKYPNLSAQQLATTPSGDDVLAAIDSLL